MHAPVDLLARTGFCRAYIDLLQHKDSASGMTFAAVRCRATSVSTLQTAIDGDATIPIQRLYTDTTAVSNLVV